MVELSDLGRRLVDNPPRRPTPKAELQRRLRRRRTNRWAAAGAAAVGCIVAVVAAVLSSSTGRGRVTHVIAPPPMPSGAQVVPVRPEAMAVSPGGVLYIADPERNQIIERRADGSFAAVVGTGRSGFTGDGGLAVRAEIADPGGMAFGRDGTLYFADDGNGRVRAVSPSGVIRTVAGGGNGTRGSGGGGTRGTGGGGASGGGGVGGSGLVSDGTAATSASLTPSDVAMGPDGHLYIAAGNQILRLEGNKLAVVMGAPGAQLPTLIGVGRPARQTSASGVESMAFDAAGNLYLAAMDTKTLLMIDSGHVLRAVPGGSGFYPRGSGGLAEEPDGQVVAIDTSRVISVDPLGIGQLVDFFAEPPAGIAHFTPDGLAVGPDGTIYLDAFQGNGYTDRSAVISLDPSTLAATLLWESNATATGGDQPGSVLLGASGIDNVGFGTAEATAIARLRGVLGTPVGTDTPESISGDCGIDSRMVWEGIVTYFDHGAFVGYATSDAKGRLTDGATEAGLRVGDPLSRARQLYGSAFATSPAQGGTWSVNTPAGTIDGYISSAPTPTPGIASIAAGVQGCPALAP